LVMPSGTNHFRDATSSIPQQVVGTSSVAAADINGDGIDDLAVFQFGGTQIWRNDGTGKFSIDPLGIPSGVATPSCGVFVPKKNGGPPDLAVFGNQSRFLLNDGQGHFKLGTAPPRPPAPFTSTIPGSCAVAADLNNDGNMDIIVAFGGNATVGTDYIQFLVNNGDGTFRDDSAARITQPARGSQGINALYLVPASKRQLRTLFLIRNDGIVVKVDSGNGIFAGAADFSPPPAPYGYFAPSDSRGTGLNDLIFGQVGSNTLQGMYALRPINPIGVAPMPDASPVLARAVNGGSFSAAIAPGSWVTLFGQNLIPANQAARTWTSADFNGALLPRSLDGISAAIGGKPASIYYISMGQLNVQAPDLTTTGNVEVVVTSPAGETRGTVYYQPIAPALFPVARNDTGAVYPAAVAADGALVADPNALSGTRASHPGEILMLYGTGFGATSPPQQAGALITPAPLDGNVVVTVGGIVAKVTYAGLVSVGLNQLNVEIPLLPDGTYPLKIAVNGYSAQRDLVVRVSAN
jgi:uncharacterized protein (TIGR03437 family)